MMMLTIVAATIDDVHYRLHLRKREIDRDDNGNLIYRPSTEFNEAVDNDEYCPSAAAAAIRSAATRIGDRVDVSS